jgi:esterase/lipase superfamily enzyme
LRAFLVFTLLSLTAACTDRSALPYAPDPTGIGEQKTVFIATQREPAEKGWFGGERAEKLSFLDVDVSIPPDRKKGKLPRRYGPNPDLNRHFAVTGRQDHANVQAFTRALRQDLNNLPAIERDVLIYVHGYNNTFTDGLFRVAQMQEDFDLKGLSVHYSWPSAANPLGYTYDRDSVLYTRDGLEQMLRAVSAAKPRKIVLVGHSLGTMLVMETLRQIEISSPGWTKRHLGGVVLVAPDLDVDVFRAQAARFAKLPYPFVIFSSSRDRALQLSRRINGSHARLGGLQDATELSDLPVTLIDVSQFATGLGADHFTPGTSPLLIQLLSKGEELQQAFESDMAGRSGLVPGTVITAQQATHVILSPLMLAQSLR